MRLGLIRMKYDRFGGAEKTLDLLARGLAERGHEVMAVTAGWEGGAPEGVQVRRVDAGKGGNRAKRFAWAALKAMRDWNPDSFLSLDKVPQSPLYRAGDGCHAAWLERRGAYEPYLRRLSFKLNPRHRAVLEIERQVLASPGLWKVVANSSMVAREVGRYYGVGPGRVVVVRNAVDEKELDAAKGPRVRERARKELGLEPGVPALLFLGSGFERKGLAFAIAALTHLPEARLLAAGKDRIAKYQAQASRAGVQGRVEFLGRRDDAPRLLAAADALVLPTIYDPCANACLEAMYLGRPVVTTEANGAAELVDEGVNGFVVPEPADAKALANACARALDLEKPTPHRVPARGKWLDSMVELLEGHAAFKKGEAAL